MWCVSRLLWSAGAGRFLFAVKFEVRGGSVLSARSVAVLAILSASYLAFLVGFRLASVLALSLSTISLYTIAQVHSICRLHKDIHLHKYKLYTCASTVTML